VLDLGCGEGYCARRLRQLGAAQVAGIDVSPAMVAAARAAEAADPLGGLHYFEGDVATATDTLRAHLPSLGVALTGELERGAFDLVLAVFVFNYVTLSEMGAAMEQAYRLLKPGGKFVFSVPLPSFPFWGRDRGPPFHFEDHGARYFSARDRLAEGRICTRDGRSLPVRCMHKTFGDYFAALGAAGFACMPEVRELSVTAELSAKDPAFFSSLEEIPLHVLFTVSKPAAPPPAAAAAAAREIIWSSVLDARDLNLDVPPAAMAELAATARALAARGVTAESYVDGDAGALPHLTAMGRAVARRLFVHHGVATLRLDMEALGCGADGSTDELSEATAKLAYYLLCHHVGAVREDRGRLFDVRCRGLDVRADNVLFSASAQECSYHTDSTNRDVFPDLVVLLCVRPAPSGGGESLLTNACNAFYALRNRLPDFLMYELARPTVRDFIGGGLGGWLGSGGAARCMRCPPCAWLCMRRLVLTDA
jgi:SAM-dependent methyltransferase